MTYFANVPKKKKCKDCEYCTEHNGDTVCSYPTIMYSDCPNKISKEDNCCDKFKSKEKNDEM